MNFGKTNTVMYQGLKGCHVTSFAINMLCCYVGFRSSRELPPLQFPLNLSLFLKLHKTLIILYGQCLLRISHIFSNFLGSSSLLSLHSGTSFFLPLEFESLPVEKSLRLFIYFWKYVYFALERYHFWVWNPRLARIFVHPIEDIHPPYDFLC